jgi:hypothetical protein
MKSKDVEETLILFISSNPVQVEFTCFKKSIAEIKERIHGAKNELFFNLVPEQAVSAQDLQEFLEITYVPQIVHFYGHGEEGYLKLESDSGQVQDARIGPLTGLFELVNERQKEESKKIRLVLLIACHSAKIAKAVSKYVDCVIGMKDSLHSTTGREFAKTFYSNLCNDHNVQDSFNAARLSIDFQNLQEERIPILCVRPGVNASEVSFPYRERITPEFYSEINQTITTLLGHKRKDGIPETEKSTQLITSKYSGKKLQIAQQVLNSLHNFFETLDLIHGTHQFPEAQQRLMSISRSILDIEGTKNFQEVLTGYYFYVSAVIETQRGNIPLGIELFSKMKDHFMQAGEIAKVYMDLASGVEPTICYLSGLRASMEGDSIKFRMHMTQAWTRSKELADKSEGSEKDINEGFYYHYRAAYKWLQGLEDLRIFEFDNVLAEPNLANDALMAVEKFRKVGGASGSVEKSNQRFAEAFVCLLQALEEVSAIIKKSFTSNFHLQKSEVISAKQKLQNANDILSAIGQPALAFVRYLPQLICQINNLEKLTLSNKT